MKSAALIVLFFFFHLLECYLDIPLQVTRYDDYISYSVPIKINDLDFYLATSLQDNQQFVLSPIQKTTKKKNKKHKQQSSQLVGVLKASSLQGYSFQGWKRFFMEAFLFLQSRYYHEININFNQINVKKQADQHKRDGLISFGPDLQKNKIYQLIKNGSDFVQNDIVSIYRGVNDKNVRMQLGGFQQTFARGYRNGILFYQIPIQDRQGKWWVPIKSIQCLRQRNGKHDIFYIAKSELKLSISIQSPWLKLPLDFASQIQRNFEGSHTTCNISSDQKLVCRNMTSIDLSLNLILLQVDEKAYINVTLYDLRQSYDEKTTQTKFYIQFVSNPNEIQIGESLFKSYYVSIDMKNKKMLFSPINRFPPDSYGVYVIRFFIAFGIFTVVTAIGAMIWQTFNDPFKKNKLMYGQDGIRLVSYQRPNQINQIDE